MNLILNPNELKEFYEHLNLKENKKNQAIDIFFNFLSYGLYKVNNTEKIDKNTLEEIIKNDHWNQLKEINILPNEKTYIHYRLDTNKKYLPEILSYFEKKGINLLIEILKEDVQKIQSAPNEYYKERITKHSLNKNDVFFYVLTKYNINFIKTMNEKMYFNQYIDDIVNISHGDAQKFAIAAINYGLNHEIEHEKLLDWFVKLVKNNLTITTKNIEDFSKLIPKYTQEELKPLLTIQEFNRVFDKQNTGVLEKESIATVYTIDLVKLKMNTKTSAVLLRSNFKAVLPMLDSILYGVNDFVSIKSSEDKQSFEINLLYEKDGSGDTKKLMNRILNYTINTTNQFDSNLYNDLTKIKNATLLEDKLSKKETNKVKNKI